MCVTSLLDYQTKQKVAAREVENRMKTGLFISFARVFDTVTETVIQVELSKDDDYFIPSDTCIWNTWQT